MNHTYRHLCSIVLFGICACSRQNNDAKPDRVIEPAKLAPDEVLISIEGAELTYAQTIRQVELRLGGPPPAGMDPARIQMVEKQTFTAVIDEFIRRELLLAEARRLDIEPEKEHIDQALQTIESTKTTDGETPSGLMYEGPDSLRREIAAGLTIEKLLLQQLPPIPDPTENEIASYLEAHPEAGRVPAQARVRHIFIILPAGADSARKEQIRNELEQARERLLQGADFSQTARMISQDRAASRGGDLGVVIQGRGDPDFDHAIFSQSVGEIGPIVQSSSGLHIIQVLERSEGRLATQEDITGLMKRNLRAENLANYINELRKRTEIRHSPIITPIADSNGT
jgi:peptidyl-prolyl cis-trans isomerase SurA